MRLPRPVIPLLLAAALLGGWEWAVRSGRADELFFPSPLHVLEWAWQGLLSGELLSATPWFRRSIEMRNPLVDPLNLVQIEFLARRRDCGADDPASAELRRLCVQGIAAGMRTTG